MSRLRKRPAKADIKTSVAECASPPFHKALDNWLARRRLLVLSIIVAISLVVRVVGFFQLIHGPLIAQHKWNQTDMNYFDAWASKIAAGDWLSRDVLPPRHIWHFRTAWSYLRNHPEEWDRLKPAATANVNEFIAKYPDANVFFNEIFLEKGKAFFTEHPEELETVKAQIVACGMLWDEWNEPRRFHQEPLYPYLVAVTYKLFGHDLGWVFLWQMTVCATGNVLIYFIARRHFGETTGAAAGLMASLCAPLLYFEMILLRESLIIFTGLFLVWLCGEAAQRRSAVWWAAAGLALGLSLTLKSHFALFLLGTLLLLAWQHRKCWKDLARLEAAAVVGIAIALAPLVARNLALGVSPLAMAGNAGVTFIHGNVNDRTMFNSSFRLRNIVEILRKTQGRMLPTIVETLKTYDSCSDYLALLWEKFHTTWHWYELSDNTNFYYYRLRIPVLRFMPVTSLIVFPLGLMGLILGVWKNRDGTESMQTGRFGCNAPHLYLLILTNLVVLMVFFVRDRYRAPMIAAMMPLAALTLTTIFQLLCNRCYARLTVIVGGIVLLTPWTATPVPAGFPLARPMDYLQPYLQYYRPMEIKAVEAGDYLKAAEALTEWLSIESETVIPLGPLHPASGKLKIEECQYYASTYHRCAKYYKLAGKEREAQQMLARAKELDAACGNPADPPPLQ
jgi:4-amino-4-deoxy-L-arabinose transferase-like glycosyltransferase